MELLSPPAFSARQIMCFCCLLALMSRVWTVLALSKFSYSATCRQRHIHLLAKTYTIQVSLDSPLFGGIYTLWLLSLILVDKKFNMLSDHLSVHLFVQTCRSQRCALPLLRVFHHLLLIIDLCSLPMCGSVGASVLTAANWYTLWFKIPAIYGSVVGTRAIMHHRSESA